MRVSFILAVALLFAVSAAADAQGNRRGKQGNAPQRGKQGDAPQRGKLGGAQRGGQAQGERGGGAMSVPENKQAIGESGVAWYTTWDTGLAEAKRSNRPIFFMSAATTCSGVPGVF